MRRMLPIAAAIALLMPVAAAKVPVPREDGVCTQEIARAAREAELEQEAATIKKVEATSPAEIAALMCWSSTSPSTTARSATTWWCAARPSTSRAI